ncbi:MAG: Hsp20/alpha crystallin family protein [Chloroflexi bacterium]|nr:Hsp20/alpha crystallin family protein [Chloroflexota bacterium]MBU1880170.1 Hsp20/alpha crystallin family protein [Chloroflexota bacterium]
MSIVRWEPLSDLMSLREAMDRLFEESFVRPRSALSPFGSMGLALDVYETGDALVVTADVPGVKAENLDISITGDVLTIKGETKMEDQVTRENYYRQERRYGVFSRSVTLPTPVNADQAEAQFKDGVLTLTIPKAEEAKPKVIKVQGQ